MIEIGSSSRSRRTIEKKQKKKKKKNASRLASEGRRAEVSCPEGEIATLYSQLTSKSSDVSN